MAVKISTQKLSKFVIIPVRFYKESDGILAVFPKEIDYRHSGVFNTCYAHMGQNASSQRSYHYHLPKATRKEYLPLYRELRAMGYHLRVLNVKRRPIKRR